MKQVKEYRFKVNRTVVIKQMAEVLVQTKGDATRARRELHLKLNRSADKIDWRGKEDPTKQELTTYLMHEGEAAVVDCVDCEKPISDESMIFDSAFDDTFVGCLTCALARQFSQELLACLGIKKLRAASAANIAGGHHLSDVLCHTHDYCDANELMARAYETITGGEPDVQDPNVCALWNSAWQAAKARDFYLP
jgi:hypothetical protein